VTIPSIWPLRSNEGVFDAAGDERSCHVTLIIPSQDAGLCQTWHIDCHVTRRKIALEAVMTGRVNDNFRRSHRTRFEIVPP
jgi:hypothetical protein